MKKIAMHVMLIALTLFLIACNPEAENKDKTEDVKTSLSFSLSYEGINELNDFSVEISISKEKDHPIDTFTLSNKELNKSFEVEEGEYLISYRLLSGETEYSGKEYECRVSDSHLEVKEGDRNNVAILVCPKGYDPGAIVDPDPVPPSTGKLVIDLGNYFKKTVSYTITPSLPNNTISGTITGNAVIEVPIGNTSVTFTVKDDDNYIIRSGNSPKDSKEYTLSNFFIDAGSEKFIDIYVYNKSGGNLDKPVLIVNTIEGSDLLGENNKYGENVKIECTVTRYTDSDYNVVKGEKKSKSIISDNSMILDSDGNYEVMFKVIATKNEEDISSKYELSEEINGFLGIRSYFYNKYEYYSFKLSRKE
ncbi:MAG: hypothetical protein PUD65_05140 [Spirochaetales bacterium]|nr:hypothetical protein [Spirochaetales bacterium]